MMSKYLIRAHGADNSLTHFIQHFTIVCAMCTYSTIRDAKTNIFGMFHDVGYDGIYKCNYETKLHCYFGIIFGLILC